MNKQYPSISVIIIGVNVEKHIENCVTSVMKTDYPNDKIEIIYVDGGSNDNSVKIAKSFTYVKTIELNDHHPTPGKGRNNGYKAAKSELIQFLDADTVIHPKWFKTAVPYIKNNIAAVRGKRIEKYPRKNNYHLIGDIEWHISSGQYSDTFTEGPCRSFGGDVLMLKQILESVDGFDETLIAGEDPDLSYRIRQTGLTIYIINAVMTTHDLNMTSFQQYFKRAYRSGHAYAEIGYRYIRQKEKLNFKELLRITLGVIVPTVIILVSCFSGCCAGFIIALIIIFRPLIKLLIMKSKYKLSFGHIFLYGMHLSFAVYPQFLGVLRYFSTCFGNAPLKNKV